LRGVQQIVVTFHVNELTRSVATEETKETGSNVRWTASLNGTVYECLRVGLRVSEELSVA
jgi:hypothetical protein